VDDDEGVRRSLERLLRSAGFSVTTFESAEGFLAAAPDSYDCVVADVYLLGMSGVDLERQLSESGGGPPVILITAHADPTTQDKLNRSRASAVLQKPFDDCALISAIERSLEPSTPSAHTHSTG
jgi:two-component system response regulator FixJ